MADINVVADAAGYVIRCNGQQVAWCADGTRADAPATKSSFRSTTP